MVVLDASFLGLWLVYVWLVWRVHHIYCEHAKSKERQNVTVAKYPSWVGKVFPGLCYLWAGPEMLLKNYRPGIPLAVKTPETSYVHFSSDEHMRELKDAPEEQLSLHALSDDMFKPKYTMNGLKVHGNTSLNGSVHLRVLRVMLRSHLPDFVSRLARIISTGLADELRNATKRQNGWTQLPSFNTAKKIITAANALVFFGADLAANPAFLEAALAYPEDLLFTAEVLRLTPSFLHPLVAAPLMRNHRARNTMVEHLTPAIEQRIRQAEKKTTGCGAGPVDCIQFFIDANGRQAWSVQKIVQVLLGVWFASVHQPALALVCALEDLCEHGEYVEPLRQELLASSCSPEGRPATAAAAAAEPLEDLHLLDAFLKESARVHPTDSISVRRKVLKPFSFRDGTSVAAGDVACVPLQAILRDEAKYPLSTTFSAWRFVERDGGGGENGMRNSSRFTDIDMSFPLWGLGAHTCPGRFYASLVLKLFLAHVLTHYDIALGPQTGSRKFSFRSAIVPKPGAYILFRERVTRREDIAS